MHKKTIIENVIKQTHLIYLFSSMPMVFWITGLPSSISSLSLNGRSVSMSCGCNYNDKFSILLRFFCKVLYNYLLDIKVFTNNDREDGTFSLPCFLQDEECWRSVPCVAAISRHLDYVGDSQIDQWPLIQVYLFRQFQQFFSWPAIDSVVHNMIPRGISRPHETLLG